MKNIKRQTPNTKDTPTSKHQDRKRPQRMSGIWKFVGIWFLVFGVSAAHAANAATPGSVGDSSFDLITGLFVFMLATFIGLEVIRRVSRLLHTPLMSLTNAISAIAVVGAILVAGPEHPTFIHVLGLVAVVASVTNIVSGFLITDRMLKMFKKRPLADPSKEGSVTKPQ